jgi:succinate dehydrogenase/fumarate reductase flavoprotein subunit
VYHEKAFDSTVDVIVVGFGDAGAVAAMTAHDEGAEVLIVEKQAEDARRPNSRFSGGLFISPNDVDAAEHYMRELYRRDEGGYETDPALIRAWAEETARNADWLLEQGGACHRFLDRGEHRHIEGYDSIHLYKPDMNEHPNGSGHSGWGWGLFKFLSERVVADRGVPVLYGTRAQWLLTNSAGAVIGLRVSDGHRTRDIGARRGVVLASGGFEFNDWLKLNYLRVTPTRFYGNPENTGDGILMAQEVGAELWHMNSCAARLVGYFPDSGYPGGCPIDIWGVEGTDGVKVLNGDVAGAEAVNLPVADTEIARPEHELPGVVFVDRYGQRFTSEVYRAHTLYYELTNLDSQRLVYPKIPSWWIFDDRRFKAGPLTPTFMGPTGPLQQIPWSADNLAEVERGWVLAADSIGDLATRCGIEPSLLTETVNRYNAACANGDDPDFHRPASTLTPLDGPTYYAVKLWPGGPNTQGGPRRNADAQVMRVTGEPIPGLYSAGELGSIYGMLYPSGGGNIAECLAFGRVAGRNAASRHA